MLILAFVLSVTLAIGTPFIVVAVRHEVRLRRIRLIDDFSRIFIDETTGPLPGADNAAAGDTVETSRPVEASS